MKLIDAANNSPKHRELSSLKKLETFRNFMIHIFCFEQDRFATLGR